MKASLSSGIDIIEFSAAKRLYQLGARPPIARNLLGLSESVANRIYEQVCGQRPRRGKLPSDVRFYFSTYQRRLHASVLAVTYQKLSRNMLSNAQKHILSYEYYQSIFGPNGQIDFCRAWHLFRCLKINTIHLLSCQACLVTFIEDCNEDPTRRACPVCFLSQRHKRPNLVP